MDGYVDTEKAVLYVAIATLIHQHGYCPISMVCKLVTGVNGSADGGEVDNAWKIRHLPYDTMTPDDARAAAREQRREDLTYDPADSICRAFAIVAPTGSGLRATLQSGLTKAARATRKRRADVLDELCAEMPGQAPEAVPVQHVLEDVGDDCMADMFDHLGC